MPRWQCARIAIRSRSGLAACLIVACVMIGCGGSGNETGKMAQMSPEFQQQTSQVNKSMAKDYAAARKAYAKANPPTKKKR